MARTFQEDWCEAVLLVDADNAFNRLNRAVALHNIQRSCPVLYQFLYNSYNSPSKLYLGDGSFLLSEEGVTQGDPLAMAKYALATHNLIKRLKEEVENVTQVWFADDSNAAGGLIQLKEWWDLLKEIGPAYGYHPKPTKTYLVLKNPSLLSRAKELFETDGVKITVEGKRQIGAAIGTEEFMEQFVKDKVEKWVLDVEQISKVANAEPQVALSAFNTGLSQRWKFIQRTMSGVGPLFQPLEDAIRNKLLPELCGRQVSDSERRLMALPYRYGGLGVLDPTQTAEREYSASIRITSSLTDLICSQEIDITRLDGNAIAEAKSEMTRLKEERFQEEFDVLAETMDVKTKRLVMAAREKGASSWLSALPLRKRGYVLNRQEFRDAICLRYGWKVEGTPIHCGCGKRNSIDHILTCKRGGYVNLRHNSLRNAEAKLMEEVCHDIRIEPSLLPTAQEMVQGTAADGARCDVSARGVWNRYDKTFFDILVTHPNAESHIQKPLSRLYKDCETLKKRKYSDRVMNIERATFTPLVFMTTGGMSKECDRLNKRLAELIATKRKQKYCHVVADIRTRLRFSLLKATTIAIRGYRHGRVRNEEEIEVDMDVAFNLIPEEAAYEA